MKKHQLDHVLRAAGRIAKYVARREKDLAFNRVLAQRGMVTRAPAQFSRKDPRQRSGPRQNSRGRGPQFFVALGRTPRARRSQCDAEG